MGKHTEKSVDERSGKHSQDSTGEQAVSQVESRGGQHRTDEDHGHLASGTPLVK